MLLAGFSCNAVRVLRLIHCYQLIHHNHLIQYLNFLQLISGVFVEVPSLSSEDNTITLRGPQEKLGVALTQVYEKVNFSIKVQCMLGIATSQLVLMHLMCIELSSFCSKIHIQ